MSIRTRIWLLGTLAIAGVFVLLGSQIIPPYRSMIASRELISNLERADVSASIVHQLQRERGLTAAYLALPDRASREALDEQRRASDQALRKAAAGSLPAVLERLAGMRHKIGERVISEAVSFDYYTGAIQQILERFIQGQRASGSPEQRRALDAHANLMYAKEYLGELRAEVVRVVATPSATNQWAVLRIGKLFGQFERHLAQFQLVAGDEGRGWVEAMMTGEDMESVNQLLVAAVDDLLAGRTASVNSGQWFAVSTRVIDSLHQLERNSLSHMSSAAQDSASAAMRYMAILSVVILCLASLALVLATSSMRRVIAAIRIMLGSLEKISAHGGNDVRLSAKQSDTAEISRSLDEMLEVIDRLSLQASTDPLTGAANRYGLQGSFEAERLRADRYGHGLAMIMMDVDHFKAINDGYGHAAGDQVLQTISALLRKNLRASDVLARWGGEEFAILIPESGSREAAAMAEKLRTTLMNHGFDPLPTVQASFGVAEYRQGDTLEGLCERADQGLYAAKRAGRNRVCVAGEPAV